VHLGALLFGAEELEAEVGADEGVQVRRVETIAPEAQAPEG